MNLGAAAQWSFPDRGVNVQQVRFACCSQYSISDLQSSSSKGSHRFSRKSTCLSSLSHLFKLKKPEAMQSIAGNGFRPSAVSTILSMEILGGRKNLSLVRSHIHLYQGIGRGRFLPETLSSLMLGWSNGLGIRSSHCSGAG